MVKELFLIDSDDVRICIKGAGIIYYRKHKIAPNRVGIRVEDAPKDMDVLIMEPPFAPPPHHFFVWYEDENGENGRLGKHIK